MSFLRDIFCFWSTAVNRSEQDRLLNVSHNIGGKYCNLLFIFSKLLNKLLCIYLSSEHITAWFLFLANLFRGGTDEFLCLFACLFVEAWDEFHYQEWSLPPEILKSYLPSNMKNCLPSNTETIYFELLKTMTL